MVLGLLRGLNNRPRVKRAVFTGTGAYLPTERLTNFDLERMVQTSDDWIVQRTGIRERRRAAADQATSDLATEAAREALAAADLPAEDVDAIVLATMTPDNVTPAAAVHVQAALGARHAAAFDLNAACTGFVYAVTVGAALVKSGIFDNVLVIGSECNSRLINWHDRNTCILFGDGAGAAVLSGDAGTGESDIIDWELGTDGTKADLITVPAGGSRRPASAETVQEELHYMSVKGREVFKFAVGIMGDMIERILSRNRLTVDDLKLIIPHQVNYRIVSACSERLGIPLEKFYLNIDRYGNTSAASIPIALDEACKAGRLQRGDLVCLLAFGAGMTWGFNLLRW